MDENSIQVAGINVYPVDGYTCIMTNDESHIQYMMNIITNEDEEIPMALFHNQVDAKQVYNMFVEVFKSIGLNIITGGDEHISSILGEENES